MWLFLTVACLILQATNSEEFKSKRHQNPQEFMTVDEVIQYWKYPSEEYEILTDDGYYLQINRIPYGIHGPGNKEAKPTVLLQHGLSLEGRSWIANLPNNSLGFILADAGCDVWILNSRGTTWSRRHQNLSTYEEEFWNFSFHEMGMYDVPAAIDFILQETEQDGLYYIGHGQGASLGLIAFSAMPELAQKVKLFIALAPAYRLVNSKGLAYELIVMPEKIRRMIWGNNEYALFSNTLKTFSAKACSHAVIDRLCLFLLFFSYGFNEKNLNRSQADIYLGIYPDFTSVKTVSHWGQIARSKEFKYFNYGSKNKAIYNTTSPPFYTIEDMTVPTAVWSGGKDICINKTDTELLLHQIPHLVSYKNIPDWQHFDHIWGLDAPVRLYPDILALFQKYK
ncbi:PREDICTED: lysosomal acid lipase/cholesteryl ester hydrolase-like [Gekko japonicus]|uniref:Lipase n=1 Tax=Gekko japonicus TaxID=146911 RepID=A0ABM1L2C2_GEKJA|nr:PREDICTED: lysosomal acid lipase/cholesteryl ester hydrolase-like [Gekko japonicus]XP_015280110.1 PREDICTED: lysosomal acid lipase/cholesteryl ester hydrolase-like [Gekko japonicus]